MFNISMQPIIQIWNESISKPEVIISSIEPEQDKSKLIIRDNKPEGDVT